MFEKNKGNKPEAAQAHSTAGMRDTAPSKPAQAPRQQAIIGPSITIKGDVSGGENLLVEGTIEGEIRIPAHEVTVGMAGKVSANIKARTVRIEGNVRGDISGEEKVVIAKQGNVRGNIVAPRVTLEDGAIFKGSIDMDPGDTATATLPLSSAESPEPKSPKPKTPGDNEAGFALKSG
jgi:cytoskeletal protein CcmA (bactofilin family)